MEGVHSHREGLGEDGQGIHVNGLVQSGSGALYAAQLDPTCPLHLIPIYFHLIFESTLTILYFNSHLSKRSNQTLYSHK